ncbi:MarR family transcriptional regulator [Novosphingobium marinum]|uniref:DNA-binding MarR family transcriptional regulator n=1 Tax=Novosphingobium marinum TaxID=1514948 RepID=A0A7Z0BRH8_9SPHN|nr:MarR family transcriptional regulator [Novosphingobium marinum]NYH93861.1 DNA-binding MarR family transcriptional regulator [Novosphingobium marinum]GGC17840.1 MarR family transcriptional regulator [Novosphingobium marinum]
MDNLGYQLVDCSRLLRRHFDDLIRPFGLTGPQARMLFTVQRSEGLNQNAYADLLEVEPITLCRMVDRMEEAGLLAREPDPKDRRARRLMLTSQGKEAINSLRPVIDAVIEDIAGALDENERSAMASGLDKLRGRLGSLREERLAANG